MTTTQKHRNFVSEPVGNKPVTAISGIGPIFGERLANAGYQRASDVLGKYLLLDGNKDKFREFMDQACKASVKHADDVFNSVRAYAEIFL